MRLTLDFSLLFRDKGLMQQKMDTMHFEREKSEQRELAGSPSPDQLAVEFRPRTGSKEVTIGPTEEVAIKEPVAEEGQVPAEVAAPTEHGLTRKGSKRVTLQTGKAQSFDDEAVKEFADAVTVPTIVEPPSAIRYIP